MNNKLYAVRDKETGKLVSDITNPRRKYWDRKAYAQAALSYAPKRHRYNHGQLELVCFELVEVKE